MASELWNIKTWAISPLDICLLCVCPALRGNFVMLFKRKQYPRALTGIALAPEAGNGAGDGVRLARVRPVPPTATFSAGEQFPSVSAGTSHCGGETRQQMPRKQLEPAGPQGSVWTIVLLASHWRHMAMGSEVRAAWAKAAGLTRGQAVRLFPV